MGDTLVSERPATRNGDWRVVIGQDAAAVDERVRSDPWTAYQRSRITLWRSNVTPPLGSGLGPRVVVTLVMSRSRRLRGRVR